MRKLLACTSLVVAGASLGSAGCASAPRGGGDRPAFDSATVWVVQGTDSARLTAEIADSRRKQEIGLSGRPSLEPDHAMLFMFDAERSGEEGFWMVDTKMPLDIAFMDAAGVIRKVLEMDVCNEAHPTDECPGYFPGVPYWSALEVRRGWFAERGFGVGARVGTAR